MKEVRSRSAQRLAQVALVALAMTVAPPGMASRGSTPPREIDGIGSWTLQRLGYGDVSYTPAHGFSHNAIRYILPARAKQGHHRWYLLHLHFRIVISHDAKVGDSFYVGALTNAALCAYLRFDIAGTHGMPVIREIAVGDVTGMQHFLWRKRSIEGVFDNYLQVRGVRPGTNTLQFVVPRTGAGGPPILDVESAAFFRDSSIDSLRAGPGRLELKSSPPVMTLHRGASSQLILKLRNGGGRTVNNVFVDLLYDTKALHVSGPRVRLRSLGPGATAIARFRVTALKIGSYNVNVAASSSSNNPGTIATVRVRR